MLMNNLLMIAGIFALGALLQPAQASLAPIAPLDRTEHVGKAEKKMLRKQARAQRRAERRQKRMERRLARRQKRMERRLARWQKRWDRLEKKLEKRGIALGENVMNNNLFRLGVIIGGIGLVVGIVFSWLLWPIGVLGWLAFVAGAILMIIGAVQYTS